METSNKQAAESEQQQNVWDALMEQCTVEKYPKDKKQETIDNITTQYGSIASMYGMDDVDTFLEQAFGVTSEVMAENIIKQEYAVDLIAEKENLKISDEEMAKRKAKWQPREPKVTTGYLARYAAMVTSGDRGAILEVQKNK